MAPKTRSTPSIQLAANSTASSVDRNSSPPLTHKFLRRGKLKGEDLVRVQRESTFLRYTANTDALQELLQFLYAECCTRNKAVKPEQIVRICK